MRLLLRTMGVTVGEGDGMAMVQVDLRAPTIPPQTRIWRLFPGEGYQFLPTFHDQRIGFLDFPGLDIPSGDLNQARDLIPRIARSQAIRDILRTARLQGATLNANALPAGIDLVQFEHARVTQYRQRLRSGLINFYQEAKDGDYVILPSPVYMSEVWVGRFPNSRVVPGYYDRRYGRIPIPSRPIAWLATFSEPMISGPLSRSLRHQHPFTLLERSFYVEVLSLVHGSFVYGDRHVATVYNDLNDFLDADAALLGAISRLSSAATRSIDLEHDHLKISELIDILIRNPPIEYTCNQATDIHSAGFTRYVSAVIVPLVIAAVVSAAIEFGSGTKADLENQLPQLQVINTADDADPLCTARVSEATKRVLHVMGTETTWALCEAARAGQRRTGMRSSAPVHRH